MSIRSQRTERVLNRKRRAAVVRNPSLSCPLTDLASGESFSFRTLPDLVMKCEGTQTGGPIRAESRIAIVDAPAGFSLNENTGFWKFVPNGKLYDGLKPKSWQVVLLSGGERFSFKIEIEPPNLPITQDFFQIVLPSCRTKCREIRALDFVSPNANSISLEALAKSQLDPVVGEVCPAPPEKQPGVWEFRHIPPIDRTELELTIQDDVGLSAKTTIQILVDSETETPQSNQRMNAQRNHSSISI